jgi:hypothetical protein
VVGGSVGTGASVGASVATTSVGASVTTAGGSVATFPPPQAARTMLTIMSRPKTDIKRLRDIFLLQKYGYSDVFFPCTVSTQFFVSQPPPFIIPIKAVKNRMAKNYSPLQLN